MPAYVVSVGKAIQIDDVLEFEFTVGGKTYTARTRVSKVTGATLQESAVKLAQWLLSQKPFSGGWSTVDALQNRTFNISTHFSTVVDDLSGNEIQVEIVDTVSVV